MPVISSLHFLVAGLVAVMPPNASPAVGAVTVIVSETDSNSTGDGSTSSSHDRDAITERIIARSDAGVELEYDLPAEVSPDERARVWQFPLRVLQPPSGGPRLLNRTELVARLDRWLKTAGLPPSACGRWVFTWNAFRIDCNPNSALAAVEPVDLGLGKLTGGVRTTGPAGTTISFAMPVDVERVRRERADSDLAVAEMSGKQLTLDAAKRAHAAERISGTVGIVYELNAEGSPRRRVKTTSITIQSGGKVERRRQTQTVERRPMPNGNLHPRRNTI